MGQDELSIIDRHFRPLAGDGAFNLMDDAGLLKPPAGSDLVVTTDLVASAVHFLPDDPPKTIAQKALRVNLSDLAAKGATPLAYVLSIGLSPDIDEKWLAGFAKGLGEDQRQFGIRLLGGDTAALPDRTVISITAFGAVPAGRMVHRFGGKPSDELFVSGMIGAGAAGLALLKGETGPWSQLSEAEQAALVRRYRVPEPRTALAPALARFASAAMDVSDGLVGDCDKLCAASGCSAVIEAEKVPLPAGLANSRDPGLLSRLITAGDDFEILAAIPPQSSAVFVNMARDARVPVERIGRLEEGPGVAAVILDGRPLPLSTRGFVHGRA